MVETEFLDKRNEKEIAIDILKIAEANLFVSLYGIKMEDLTKRISEDSNHIFWIFGHCANHMDYVFGELCQGKKWFNDEIHQYFAYGVAKDIAHQKPLHSFKTLIETYLELSESVMNYLENLPLEKFREKPEYQKEGERIESIFNALQRVALHFMGHMGQITMIRRTIGNPVPMGFVAGMANESREMLKTNWMKWWQENKEEFI